MGNGWCCIEANLDNKLAEASKPCMALVKYVCKRNFSKHSKSKKHGLPCTEVCLCSGGCMDSE